MPQILVIRRAARVLLMWEHFQAGGLGPPCGPILVKGEALVETNGAKPPEANGFYILTVQFYTFKMTPFFSIFVYDFTP